MGGNTETFIIYGAVQLVAEVLHLKNVNIIDKMMKFLDERRVQLILQALSAKKIIHPLLNSIEKSTNKDPAGNFIFINQFDVQPWAKALHPYCSA